MNAKKWVVAGLITATVAVLTAWAIPVPSRTLRTTASIGAVFQIPNPLATNTDVLAFDTFAGHDLVNLALGTALTTPRTNEVLAMDINCDSTRASLVIFDEALSSNIATIAHSTSVTALTGQDNPSAAGPNHERFVIQMDVNSNSNLVGGTLTIAGRVFLTPSNGCPAAVLVDTDRLHDKGFADGKVKDVDNRFEKDKTIAGEAHLIGVADVVFIDGTTNTVLLPFGQLTMRRVLLSN